MVKGLFAGIIFILIILFWTIPLPDTHLRYGQQLFDAQGRELYRGLSPDGFWRLPLALDQVDPQFIQLLLRYEDQRFYHHIGVDPLALLRASWQLLTHGQIVSGASTLSMQTVRLLQPKERSFKNKLVEMVQAIKLEWFYRKQDILKLYLELAPYGGNIQGIRAASLFYFGKEPKRLNLSEIALLIALPQSPEKRRPDRQPQAALMARNQVLKRLAPDLNAEALAIAQQQPVPNKRLPAPRHAYHLAQRLSGPTTLQAALQIRLEQWARSLPLQPEEEIAVLVAHDHQIIAYLGSSDFKRTALDLAQAIRSPGSTLKPFIYGLGFELGLMHPLTKIEDRFDVGTVYAPHNFDRRSHGRLDIRQALIQSLNIPAVKALQRIGAQRLWHRLQSLGMDIRLPKGASPNLAIALGGLGLSLQDLTALYAALSQNGQYRSLQVRSEQSSAKTLLSPEATAQLDWILAQMPPPEGWLDQGIRYKTGTSYGFRDAWSIGYRGDYTVGIWRGYADARPTHASRTGRAIAAPLLFSVFNLLPPQKKPPAQLPSVPPALRHWSSDQSLRITAPIAKTIKGQQVLLQADGGQAPYHWLINDRLLNCQNNHCIWQPTSPGFYQIRVLDAQGQWDQIKIQLLL